MNKKRFTLIFVVIVGMLTLIIISYVITRSRMTVNTYFPKTPTQTERDASKKLPKSQCSCWDGVNNICLPQADCI